jgi:hypothetical protein
MCKINSNVDFYLQDAPVVMYSSAEVLSDERTGECNVNFL